MHFPLTFSQSCFFEVFPRTKEVPPCISVTTQNLTLSLPRETKNRVPLNNFHVFLTQRKEYILTMKFYTIYHQINLSDKIIIINIQGQRKTVTVINTEEKNDK